MREIKLNDNNETILWKGRKAAATSAMDAVSNKAILLAMIVFLIDMLIFTIILLHIGPKSAAGYYRKTIWVHYVPVVIYLIGAAVSIIRSVTTDYVLTNKYVYVQSGLFKRTILMNDIDDVEYVSVRKNVFDRIAHTGDIIIFTKDEIEKDGKLIPEETVLRFENISDYSDVYNLIQKIRNRTGSMTDPAFVEELLAMRKEEK